VIQQVGRRRLLVILIGGVACLAITGTALGAFVTKGTTRYAFASANVSSPTTTASSSFVDMSGMSVSVSIPSGKAADLFITFSSELNGCGPVNVRAIVDTSANIAAPGAALLFSHTGGSAEAHAFTWMRTVGTGSHTVKIQWLSGGGCDHAFAGVRSLFVTANVH
jgi:hypothetical protein